MPRPLIVFVGADKGGVGKTVVSRALMDYFRERGINARAFDTQVPEGNLKRFFPHKTEIVDIMHSDGQMLVFDTLGQAPVTLIDMRAGILTPTIKSLADLGFLRMVKEGKIGIAVLHVIGSTVASFQEIAATAASLAAAKHFIVTNHTNEASFFAGIGGVPREALENATVIDIPKLTERAAEFVDAASASFSDFAKDENRSLTMRRYVESWLVQVFAAFDGAKLDVLE